jgi:hypothetical protein
LVQRLIPDVKLTEFGKAKIRRLARYGIRVSHVNWYIAECYNFYGVPKIRNGRIIYVNLCNTQRRLS